MTSPYSPGSTAPAASNPTVLWVAIAVLGAALLAMGAMLLRSTAAPTLASSEPVALAPQSTTPDASGVASTPAPGATAAPSNPAMAAAKKPVPGNAAVRPTEPAQKAPTVLAQSPTAEPAARAVERIPPAPPCAVCGTVESATAVQREPAAGSGVGVIAGAAIGGLLGNQVGAGTGKDLATIAGMVGGGWAGNTVEKKLKRETVYEVAVRMQDGSLRKLEHKTAVAVGTPVTVNGSALSVVPR